MDTLDVDDAARLVRDLRDRGLADSTIHGILVAASRVMKFARRRMRWNGENVIAGLDSSERPQTSGRPRRRIFTLAELAQVLKAAEEPWRTMFALDAVTGARQSEVLGLIWSDFDLGDVDDAIVRFIHQLSRSGERSSSPSASASSPTASVATIDGGRQRIPGGLTGLTGLDWLRFIYCSTCFRSTPSRSSPDRWANPFPPIGLHNSFAAPAARNCDLLGLNLAVTALVNPQSGLPSAAGTNEAVQDVNIATGGSPTSSRPTASSRRRTTAVAPAGATAVAVESHRSTRLVSAA